MKRLIKFFKRNIYFIAGIAYLALITAGFLLVLSFVARTIDKSLPGGSEVFVPQIAFDLEKYETIQDVVGVSLKEEVAPFPLTPPLPKEEASSVEEPAPSLPVETPNQPSQKEREPSQEKESILPASLIDTDQILTYEVENIEEVKNIIAERLAEKDPAHILSSLSFATEEGRFLALDEMLNILGITIPSSVMEEFDDQFELILFRQKEGGRLALMVKLKDPSAIKEEIALWEPTMVRDSEKFFALLGKKADIGPFRSATWQGIPFRYFDFLPARLGIVYAIYQEKNLLIFTSSGESMIEIINRLEAG